MPLTTEIVPFSDAHADGAALLLAERQARLRGDLPGLPQRWCEPTETRSRLDTLRSADSAVGFAALEGDRLAGFLVGEMRPDAPWDRAGWVELAGHAVVPSRPDVARDLFAAWSARLLHEFGVFRYLVNVPATDRDAVEAWSQLGFGQMHCGAIRSTEASDLGAPDPAIAVRAGAPGDEAIMGRASELIWREQASPPSWSPMLPERIEPNRADWIQELTLGDPIWIAEDAASHEPLGVSVSYPLDPDLDIPEENIKLAATATFPAARRRGVGRALLRQVLAEGARRGAPWCVTDWRTSSLLASRAWTGLGFSRTRLRMERVIDQRVAWQTVPDHMPDRIDVAPLTAADLPAAASLLAARQQRLQRARPNLPEAYADPAATLPLLEALTGKEGAFGVIGRRNGEPFGFLLGYPRPEPIWGRAAWSPIEGSALADDIDPELVRDLYAAWSEHFVRRGYFRQYVHAAANEAELMAAWVRTGFGQMQAHAARDLDLAGDPPPGVTLRRAHAKDIGLVVDLLPLVGRALMKPPAYAIQLPEVWSTFGAAGSEELADPDARHWVAIADDSRALALASFYDAEPGPMVPDRATELAFAMTRPEERGRGLMRALAAAGFAEAKAAGAESAVADWRTASLPTHRSWVALGFEPLYYRLHRHIDDRIAWAANSPLADPG